MTSGTAVSPYLSHLRVSDPKLGPVPALRVSDPKLGFRVTD
jgi:hypothetical protein